MFKGDLRRRLPRFFWLFLAAFVAFIAVMAGLSALGFDDRVGIVGAFVAVTLLAYAAAGVLSPAVEADDWFVAARSVPPVFNGMANAAAWVSGPVFVGLAGGLYFGGHEALALLVGWTGGLLLMATLFAPYLRKAGCYTVPEFIGIRFGGGLVRVLAVAIVIVVALIMLTAQLGVMGLIAERMLDLPYLAGVWIGLAAVLCCTMPGGLRSATWVQVAQYAVLVIAFVVPVIWISAAQGTGYLPQIAYGALERAAQAEGGAPGADGAAPAPDAAAPAAAATTEATQGGTETAVEGTAAEGAATASGETEGEAEAEAEAEENPFAGLRTLGDAPAADGAAEAWRFVALALCLMAGAAAMPHMLIRMFAADTARGAGRSVAWSLLFVLAVALTAPALAVLVKVQLLDPSLPGALAGQSVEQAGALDWVARWTATGAVALSDLNADGVLQPGEIGLSPEVVTLAAPEIAGLPVLLSGLVAAGAIAAAMSTAVVTLLAMATAVGQDVHYATMEPDATLRRRLGTVRWMLVVIGVVAGLLAVQRMADPLVALLWAAGLAASGLFVPLALAVWWRRATQAGAIAGMVFGFAAGALYGWSVHAGMEPWLGLDAPRFGLVGMTVSLVAMVAVSLLTPEPEGEIRLMVDDIRRPYGAPVLPRTH